MNGKRKFLFLGGILLIIAGIIEICSILAGGTIPPSAVIIFIVASICMLIDLGKKRKDEIDIYATPGNCEEPDINNQKKKTPKNSRKPSEPNNTSTYEKVPG